MPTPHNAAQLGDFAKVVLMPGDPLRAKHVAENYLEDARLVNEVRGMLAFTGTYDGMPVSVMGSGMGVPSIAIYAHELFNHYGVQAIIRTGTTGALAPEVKLRDVIFAQAACTDSNFAAHYRLKGTIAPICDFGLLRHGVEVAEKYNIPHHVGNVFTTDTFYRDVDYYKDWIKMGVLSTEMETSGLYCIAAEAHKRALSILTVSDAPLRGEGLSAEERQTACTDMARIALEVARDIANGVC